MLSVIAEAEAELQEILHRAAATMRATKAALYLSHDGQPYELVTQFGFQVPPRRQIGGNDVVVDRLITRKSGYWINGQTTDQKFYEILYHTGTDRILVMPIFNRSQLIGFIDVRDKEGREPFRNSDFADAKEIVGKLVEFLAARRLFGLQATPENGAAADVEIETSTPRIIERARMSVERTLHTYMPKSRLLTEPEIGAAAAVLPAVLSLKGAVLAAVSAFGHMGNVQQIAARAPLSEAASETFDTKLKNWLKKQTEYDVAASTRTHVVLPFGESNTPLQPQQFATVLSAPLKVENVRGLVLSVAFEVPPDDDTRDALEGFHALIQQMIVYAMSHLSMRTHRQKIAEKLLEPDFQKFPELLDHSRRVSSLADQFARFLKLPLDQVETVRLSAFLHDVGMRLLDYRRLYNKKSFNEEDQKLMREHPVVGAALIVDSPLGEEIANIVLCHHERPDGKGYPHGLVGEQIPYISRIVHICEAFDAMTAIQSYQPPMPESAALVQITRGAGAQFDLELARRFVEMLQSANAFGFES